MFLSLVNIQRKITPYNESGLHSTDCHTNFISNNEVQTDKNAKEELS